MDEVRHLIYCLVPEHLQEELLGDLRTHFAGDDRVRVIVERRKRERRASARGGMPSRSREEEVQDRRSGTDRRRPALPRWFDVLPPHLARRAEGVKFVQRMLPNTGILAGMDVLGVVEQVRNQHPEAPTELYWRIYERVHSRLSLLLGDPETAEKQAPTGFGHILDAIENSDSEIKDFDTLLYDTLDRAFEDVAAKEEEAAEEEFIDDGMSLAITDPTLDEPVQIAERDPSWFGRGMSERDKILRAAREHVQAVEHIGSTGVPAIAARPIVDIMIGVERMQEAAELRNALVELGYERCGNAGMPGRAYYRKRGVLEFDVHVVKFEGELWNDAISLRDFLRRNPGEAANWAGMKRRAARAPGGDMLLKYAEHRAPALRELMERAAETSQRAA
jgi:GrpB-like predicted nucleotidyltransferase (UPF0157 family)